MARPKKDEIESGGISAKDKIMDAAENLFASKGYDAATIGEIGKLAGVNSALLYYYFANKEAILRQLMETAIQEVTRMVDERFSKIVEIDSEAFELFITDILDFLRRKKQILIIMMGEVLRAGREDHSIFELLSPVYDNVIAKLKELNVDVGDINYLRIKLFLICTSPLLMSVVIGEEWAVYNKIDETEYRSKYMAAMKELSTLLGFPFIKK
jgi:AcrR family transcriptional regulator